jgi:RNA polymerase sigma-54 factor
MKQALQLKLGQQLTLTPQLQQAIKLLQLSTLDLQQTITETLESNPLLDEEDTLVDQVDERFKRKRRFLREPSVKIFRAPNCKWMRPGRMSCPLRPPRSSSQSTGDSDMNFAERDSLPETLQSHLLWQLNLTRFSAADHTIALAFIDAVDVDGRLTQTPEQIHLGLASDDLSSTRSWLFCTDFSTLNPQAFLPPICASAFSSSSGKWPWTRLIAKQQGLLVSRHIEQIPVADPKNLARRMRTTPDDIAGALSLIRFAQPNAWSIGGK